MSERNCESGRMTYNSRQIPRAEKPTISQSRPVAHQRTTLHHVRFIIQLFTSFVNNINNLLCQLVFLQSQIQG